MINRCVTYLNSWAKYLDRELILAVMFLLSLGFVVMTSASLAVAERNYNNPLYFMHKQLIFIGLGLIAAWVVFHIRISFWENLGIKILPLIIILLILVLIPGIGKEVNGSYRWLDLRFMNLQVSEAAKLAILLYMAGYVARHERKLQSNESLLTLIIPLIVLGIFSGLFLLEPDLGTVVVVMATGIALLFVGGLSIQRLVILISAVVLAMLPFLWMGYRAGRMEAYFNPWEFASGKGYQTIQALIAIGDGGWFGAGLGGSVQKQFYLPEAHNDFIFAVLAEEFGFMGIVITLVLFAWLVQRAFAIGYSADKLKLRYSALISYGIGFWIGFQILFHIGVNMAILPSKGLTLPLMSYGGSSIMITLISMGLLQRIHRETQSVLLGSPVVSGTTVKKESNSRRKLLSKRKRRG